MYKKIMILASIAILMILGGCGKNTVLPPHGDSDVVVFGTDTTFDVVTWNLREFPWLGETTVEALAQLIPLLKADVIAFQEINSYAPFNELAGILPDYDAYISNATSSYRLAYLVNNKTVQVEDNYTIFNSDSNPFPRPPYILKAKWNEQEYYVIDNHLKAYGDNYIDESDDWDEEVRRRLACEMLDEYISAELGDKKVIVVGDFNDQIAEPATYNVFMSFINKPAEYQFADMPIAQNPTYSTVSYPASSSHIDHVLITNELFDSFAEADSTCRSILVEEWFGSWSNYSGQISDHRPVGIRLK